MGDKKEAELWWVFMYLNDKGHHYYWRDDWNQWEWLWWNNFKSSYWYY